MIDFMVTALVAITLSLLGLLVVLALLVGGFVLGIELMARIGKWKRYEPIEKGGRDG